MTLRTCSTYGAQGTTQTVNIKPIFNNFATIRPENTTEYSVYTGTSTSLNKASDESLQECTIRNKSSISPADTDSPYT